MEMVGGSAVAGSVEGARAVAASVEWKEVVCSAEVRVAVEKAVVKVVGAMEVAMGGTVETAIPDSEVVGRAQVVRAMGAVGAAH